MKKVFLVTIMILLLLLTGCNNQKKNSLNNSDNIIKEENKNDEKSISDNINEGNTTIDENTTKEEVNTEDKELENQIINNQNDDNENNVIENNKTESNETENNNNENNDIENKEEISQEEVKDVEQDENNETIDNEEEQKKIIFKRPTEYGVVFDYYEEINKKERYRNTNIISKYDSPIYSVADGVVIITEACSELVVANNCLNIYVKHNMNGMYIYSVYKYVFNSEVSREQKVTVDTVLGHVGYLREKQAGFIFYMIGGRNVGIINPRIYVYLPKSYQSYYER